MRALLIVLACSTAACAGTQESGTRSGVQYGRDAQEAYENALSAFRRDDCLDAEPAFRRVRREYPYSRFAALSELRIADCKFKQRQFAEAIAAYRQFIRFRPSHSQIPYARFRIAESNFEQIPSEWLLSPPGHERDQQATREALRQLRRFILDYPEDARLAEVQRMVNACMLALAKHELYVARFYLRRDAFPAVVNRLRTLLATYDGSGIEPEALLLLGETYGEMHDAERQRQAYQELVQRFPESDEAEDARDELN